MAEAPPRLVASDVERLRQALARSAAASLLVPACPAFRAGVDALTRQLETSLVCKDSGRSRRLVPTRRRRLIDLLTTEPRSASSLAKEMGLRRGDIEEDLGHALRTAIAEGHTIEVVPARCKDCTFVFGPERLSKPGRCPACKAEPVVRAADPAGVARRSERREAGRGRAHGMRRRRTAGARCRSAVRLPVVDSCQPPDPQPAVGGLTSVG